MMSQFTPPHQLARLARTCRSLAAAAVLGVAAAGAAPMLGFAPEPDPVPRRWQLEVQPGPLRVATVDVKGVGPRSYLYMTYTAVNSSGEDLLFAPMFDLSTGDGQTLRSGRDVPQAVTTELLSRAQDQFMQDQISIIGEFLQGEENAKHGVVIWPLKDMSPAKITVYAAGFSGETKTVDSPDGKQKFILRKTLMLDYNTPGSLEGQKSDAIPLREKSWIMR
jgi:hypothetical protein